MNLILILDNDPAGEAARKTIKKDWGHMFNIYDLYVENHNDIGEMLVKEVIEELLPYITAIEGDI